MTADLSFVHGALWPYVLIVICGFLPTEVWRVLGVLASRGVAEGSPFLSWVRAVSTALLAAVVAKLLLSPSGALALVPWWGRTAPIVLGLACFFVFRRSFFAGILVGEGALIVAATLWGG